jgi:cytochrome c biogenesis protein CcmG/thiol:disulfide interchange protein DsbE
MTRPRALLRTLSLPALAVAAIAALVVFGLASSRGREGRPAPALPREVLSGAPVTLATLRGHPALVVFWASWCVPCEQEAPALERFWQGPHERVALVGVNTSDPSEARARAFIGHYDWTFPNLRDPQGTVGAAYGIADLPTTFVLDGDGRVRQVLRGPQTQRTLTEALRSVGS